MYRSIIGAPGMNRTCDLRFRNSLRPVLGCRRRSLTVDLFGFRCVSGSRRLWAVRLGDDSAALFAVAVAVDAWRTFVDKYPQLAPVAGLVKTLPGGRKMKGAQPIDGARFRFAAEPRGRLVRRLRVG